VRCAQPTLNVQLVALLDVINTTATALAFNTTTTFVADTSRAAATATVVLMVTVTEGVAEANAKASETTTTIVATSTTAVVTVVKKDNGALRLGEIERIGTTLTAAPLNLSDDPDGVNTTPNVSYLWDVCIASTALDNPNDCEAAQAIYSAAMNANTATTYAMTTTENRIPRAPAGALYRRTRLHDDSNGILYRQRVIGYCGGRHH